MFGFLKTGFQTIKSALKKTRSFLGSQLQALFSKKFSEETLDELEQILYQADLGSKTVADLIAETEALHKKNPHASFKDYLDAMQKRAESLLELPPKVQGKEPSPGYPKVVLILGVNGSGKTTTIAKLAHLYQKEGKKVLLAAGDTFRAAAVEQLSFHAEKIGVDIVKALPGQDPASILYDAMQKGIAKGYDLVLCDTAGRLESKTDLLHELAKMSRIAKKLDPLAPHEVYLIVDATLGQTVVEQARIFGQHVPLTGFILTKVDGSAKGGVALALYREEQIPIAYICFGETVDAIAPFEIKSYTEALFSV